MKKTYHPVGTCSTAIHLDIDETTHTLRQVCFERGCNGNTQGVAALAQGMKIEDVVARLEGIRCGKRGTSCPDQLACALKECLGEMQ